MKHEKTLYEILGLTPQAGTDAIKKSFRALALLHHPDKNDNSTASQVLFRVINDAYTTLVSAERRAAYDMYLKTSGAVHRRHGAEVSESAGDKRNDVEYICTRLNFILWEIEDILASRSFVSGDHPYDGCPVAQYLEIIIVFIDRWVLEPSCFIDYFHTARNPGAEKRTVPFSSRYDKGVHRPYIDLRDYFYEIRKRSDRFFRHVTPEALMKKIEGRNVTLLDAIFEALLMACHYLGSVRLLMKHEIKTVGRFTHSNPCYEDGAAAPISIDEKEKSK
ncbi:MAG: DnaJ domain-containing protein [Spirochaetales bacterium]|nr:DnaJ domain-containing protein [Spirochaetales bacterium]